MVVVGSSNSSSSDSYSSSGITISPSTVAGHKAFLTISLKYRWISSSLALGGMPPA